MQKSMSAQNQGRSRSRPTLRAEPGPQNPLRRVAGPLQTSSPKLPTYADLDNSINGSVFASPSSKKCWSI